MTRGVLLFANNNAEIDYLKQACFCAKRIQNVLKLPVTLVTDSREIFDKKYKQYSTLFDNVISFKTKHTPTSRIYKDSLQSAKSLEFKNNSRVYSYDLTPYDETIVMDTDVILFNSVFNKCFEQKQSILMYDESKNVSNLNSYTEFENITDSGIKFYWATCIYFKKDTNSKIFFELLKHIQENWDHYRLVYGIRSALYRNDFVFSIATHILNGFKHGNFVGSFPGTLFFSTDIDCVIKIEDNGIKLLSLAQDSNTSLIVNISDANVHVMNKYSLERNIVL